MLVALRRLNANARVLQCQCVHMAGARFGNSGAAKWLHHERHWTVAETKTQHRHLKNNFIDNYFIKTITSSWSTFDSVLCFCCRLLPGSARTRRRSDVAGSGAGTLGGWCPDGLGCHRPAAKPRPPQTPPLPPAVMSHPLDTSGGRCHFGSGCSEQLWRKVRDNPKITQFISHLLITFLSRRLFTLNASLQKVH